MVKKISIILLTCIVAFVSFCASASAQSIITGSIPNTASTNRLYLPERYIALVATPNGDGTYSRQTSGTIFETSPRYVVPSTQLPQTTYVNNSNSLSADNTPTEFRYLYHRYAQQSDNTAGRFLSNTLYLSRMSQAQTTNVVWTQVDFPRAYVNKNIPQLAWNIYISDDGLTNDENNLAVNYAYGTLDDIQFHTITLTKNINRGLNTTLDMHWIVQQIYAYAENNPEYAPYEFGDDICIGQISFSYFSKEGFCRIIERVDQRFVDQFGNNDILGAKIMPNMLTWLSKSVGGFFGTTLFELGSFNVTLGTVVAVPLVLWVLIAFLKKFAGG